MVWNLVFGVGAAVAGRLIDGEGKKSGEPEDVQIQKAENKQIKRRLKETQRELEAKDSSYKQAVEQCERFKHQASSLEVERNTFARKADSATQMAAQAAGATLAMSLQHRQLVEQYAKLEGHAKELLKERNELADKMQQLEVQQQEAAAAREAALKELADKISGILKQYFGQHISEADTILRMAELGVDIDPAAVRGMSASQAQEFQVETKLLLADPGRMQRLMQSARQPQLLGNGPSTSSSSQGAPNVPRLQLNFNGFKENSSSSSSAGSMLLSWSDSHKAQDTTPQAELSDATKLLRGPDTSSSTGSPAKAAPAAGALASSAAVVKAGDGKLTLELPSKTSTPTKKTTLGRLFAKSSSSSSSSSSKGTPPRPGRVTLLDAPSMADDQGSFLVGGGADSRDLMKL